MAHHARHDTLTVLGFKRGNWREFAADTDGNGYYLAEGRSNQ